MTASSLRTALLKYGGDISTHDGSGMCLICVETGAIIFNVLLVWLCMCWLMAECADFETYMVCLNLICGLQTGTGVCEGFLNKRVAK